MITEINHPYDGGEYLAREIEKQMRRALGNELYESLDRLCEEANRKRSEAAKGRDRAEQGTFEPVREQFVPAMDSQHPERQAKAAASKTNAGLDEQNRPS